MHIRHLRHAIVNAVLMLLCMALASALWMHVALILAIPVALIALHLAYEAVRLYNRYAAERAALDAVNYTRGIYWDHYTQTVLNARAQRLARRVR